MRRRCVCGAFVLRLRRTGRRNSDHVEANAQVTREGLLKLTIDRKLIRSAESMNVVENNLHHGIRYNLSQFFHQLLQVLLVGLTIGITRTVVPALAESDFGMPRNSFVLLSLFVVAFGLVKAAMNFIAGRLSESIGRKKVLLLGWLAALPIPLMIWYAPTWTWIVTLMESVGMAIVRLRVTSNNVVAKNYRLCFKP